MKPKCEIRNVQALVSNSARDKRTVGVAIRITLLFYTEVARRLDRATCVNSPTFVYSKALFKKCLPRFFPKYFKIVTTPGLRSPANQGRVVTAFVNIHFQTVSLSADYL